jgi:hypothetical protein
MSDIEPMYQFSFLYINPFVRQKGVILFTKFYYYLNFNDFSHFILFNFNGNLQSTCGYFGPIKAIISFLTFLR